MKRSGILALLAIPSLLAQSQPTFYAAYQDGLEAEGRKDWQAAAGAFRRAIHLRPAPAGQVIIYGNNLLKDYYPYGHLARCQLELGHFDAAAASLGESESRREPASLRDPLLQRLGKDRAPASLPKPKPAEPSASPTPEPGFPKTQPEGPGPVSPAIQPPPAAPASTTDSSQTGDRPLEPSPKAPDQGQKGSTFAPSEPSNNPAPQGPQAAASLPAKRSWQPGWPLFSLAGAALLGGIFWAYLRRGKKENPESFREPKHYGPYRVERLLGRGGFASTYLARHETTGALVALKALHPYRMDDPEFLERFRREAKLGAMLNHPNLVRLVDPGPEEGTPWLAMEYVAGQPLDQILKQEGALPLPRLLTIAREIAEGLAHAHRFGIVHRDLKPGNVILAGDQAKVMDFGISRIMDAQTLTTTYAFLGTPLYAAPEAQLKTHVAPSADLYAFGIMLFEMLTGGPPFKGETPFEILDQHRTKPLPNLAALRPDAPAALITLIERLCRKAPEERPGDEEVLVALAGLTS